MFFPVHKLLFFFVRVNVKNDITIALLLMCNNMFIIALCKFYKIY